MLALALARSRSRERAAPVSDSTLRMARREVERGLGGPLQPEQRQALETITGPGGVTMLVGQAGTGKGVVLSAAAEAWRHEGHEVIGTAVAGATAERLGADARLQRSLNTDAFFAASSGARALNSKTVVVMDEAGMADTNRLAALAHATASARASSCSWATGATRLDWCRRRLRRAAGAGADGGASEVHRARHQWEREAWEQVRKGEADRPWRSTALRPSAHRGYPRGGAAQMVSDWDVTPARAPEQDTVMLTDASNVELDRINLLAQERARQGELGAKEVAAA